MFRSVVTAIVFLVLAVSPTPGAPSVDWGSIHSFTGNYHAVTIQDGGNREEVSGRIKIPFDRSYMASGALQHIFTGTSDASARTSGPAAKGPCAFQQPDPNHSGHDPAVRIDLFINMKKQTYSWNVQPIKIHFEAGGYSPECGGYPRAMITQDLGIVSVGNLPLPKDSDILCGKAMFKGEDVRDIDWYFYPDDGKPRQPPVCPAVQNAAE